MKAEAKLQKWFSKTEVAARYNICPRTVERWVAAGQFPAGVLFNKRWRWPVTVIESHERALVGGTEASAA